MDILFMLIAVIFSECLLVAGLCKKKKIVSWGGIAIILAVIVYLIAAFNWGSL